MTNYRITKPENLPDKRLLRYGEVRAYLGVSDRDMEKFITAGLLDRHYLPNRPQGKAYYFRDEVLEFERNWKAKEISGREGISIAGKTNKGK